jgi:hypothetical protein
MNAYQENTNTGGPTIPKLPQMNMGFGNNTTSGPSMFTNQNAIIVVLVVLLVLSFLGINIILIAGNTVQTITSIFGPIVGQILGLFGYTFGTVLNRSADVVTDTAKTGLDIANGTVHNIGNLIGGAGAGAIGGPIKQNLDAALNRSRISNNPPKADDYGNPIQQPITAGKRGWCLVGEYQGRRGCIDVDEQDQCLSGQVYPTQKMCLNPTFTQNSYMSNQNHPYVSNPIY